jgi:ABC-type multidrug transport system fused ATPase/permease subunit
MLTAMFKLQRGVVLQIITSYALRLFAGTVCTLASTGMLLLLPALVGMLFGDLPKVRWQLAIVLLIATLAQAAFSFGGTYWIGYVAARSVVDLRKKLFSQLILAPVPFHDENWSANLTSAITTDAVFIEQSLNLLLPVVVRDALVLLFGTAILLSLNLQLTLTIALVGMPIVLVVVRTSRTFRSITYNAQQVIGRMAVMAQESLLGIRAVKSLVREEFFIRRFDDQVNRLFALKRRRVLLESTIDAVLPIGVIAVAFASVIVVRRQLESDSTSTASLVSFAGYLAVMGASMRELVTAYAAFQTLRGAVQRIRQIDRAVGVGGDKNGKAPIRGLGEIQIEHLTFEYSQGHGVRDINLKISPGDVLALVGPNGAGKSTLVNLLLRFYRPQSGCIRSDGTQVETFDLGAWRRLWALVTRDPAIFSLTIGENIALGRENALPADIRRAAQAVGLEEFIEHLPDKYDTNIGEEGVRLSAGQRQRLVLARTFLQNPACVILDEATTSLDTESERIFLEAFREWLGARTAIIITHQQQPFLPITRLIHMENGRIVSGENVTAQ